MDFFSMHPVFTRDEFAAALADGQKAVSFSVPARVLEELQSLRPRAPHYLDRSTRGKLLPTWNLIVPAVLLEGERESVR